MDTHTLNDNPSTLQYGAKRVRNLPSGRPLPLSRLLNDLDKQGLQALLKTLCERHPGLSLEVYQHAPKPTVASALGLMTALQNKVQASFPFGGDSKGEYAYNRVLPHIRDLLEALMDYTPHFLPPNEAFLASTMAFLEGATTIISRLPDWHNPNHALLKREAFEEINGAWITAFREANRRNQLGLFQYQEKLRRFNELSGDLLEGALSESQKCNTSVFSL